jgi:hypothetical protein
VVFFSVLADIVVGRGLVSGWLPAPGYLGCELRIRSETQLTRNQKPGTPKTTVSRNPVVSLAHKKNGEF